MQRRTFLKLAAGFSGLNCVTSSPLAFAQELVRPLPFKLSLAEWSLVKSIRAGRLTNLDFPRVARREFGIDCIELVDQFFADKATDQAYLGELKKRAADEGVSIGLIMIDTNGALGAADAGKRKQAVEATLPWIDAAKFLGGRLVRVNAYGDGDAAELRGRVAESCSVLADYAATRGLAVAIENHGKLSSDPEWLTSVMAAVNKPNFGTLPDFGNFPPEINRYDAVEKLLLHAKAVSAKAMEFTPEGLVKETDFFRMMRLVRDSGYDGHVGVESGGANPDAEYAAVRATRDLLLRVRAGQQKCQPIFNGRNLDGWRVIEGGEWTIADGVLTGRNGRKWTTNPELTGSWLCTEKSYQDFSLELQYAINERGNSGVFFRAATEKNPAFTGYEMQILDAAGRPPSKTGATSIYDTVGPTQNRVRPAGQWNTVTITAKGPHIEFEMNGEKVLEAELTRSLQGRIGLQNHDDRAVVKFRNIRLAEL
jgi:sugar phosphate isomerase/epimerase